MDKWLVCTWTTFCNLNQQVSWSQGFMASTLDPSDGAVMNVRQEQFRIPVFRLSLNLHGTQLEATGFKKRYFKRSFAVRRQPCMNKDNVNLKMKGR